MKSVFASFSLTPLVLVIAGCLSLTSPTLVAAEGDTCARISTFDVGSRQQNLFPAVLIAIDDGLPGPVDTDSWRVAPGKHTLKVAEAIDANRFAPLQNRERDGRNRDRYKELTFEAEAGLTYRLAARFFPDQRDNMRSGGYWQPEIWTTKPEACG